MVAFSMQQRIQLIERLRCYGVIAFTKNCLAYAGDLLNKLGLWLWKRIFSDVKILDSVAINVFRSELVIESENVVLKSLNCDLDHFIEGFDFLWEINEVLA